MILRKETFDQTNGLAMLELRGESFELAVFLHGEPLLYDASDCMGSVGRFMVLLPSTQSLSAQMQIEANAKLGFSLDEPLQDQLSPLLQLLPNGSYRLLLEEIEQYEVLDWSYGSRSETGWVMGYYAEYNYADSQALLTTQPSSNLSDERVNFYIAQIESGVRPALIGLSSKLLSEATFVIDGRHKLQAYVRTGVAPHVLRIEFEQTTSISNDLAHQILKDVEGGDVRNYLQTKERSL